MPTNAPTYRYLLCDLLTDRVMRDLPLSGVTFDRRISRVGSLSANLEASTALQVQAARTLYEYAGRSALWVFRNGQLWWGGIPWTVEVQQGDRGAVSVSVQAATFDSYPHHRVLRQDLTYTQVDQGVIIPDLWRTLQQDPRGDIGMVAEDQPTGVLRDRTYPGGDLEYFGKLIENLGDVEGGAEHTVDVFLDGAGSRVKRLRVANRLGTAAPRWVFQGAAGGGGQVQTWKDTADAVDGGTTFQVRGDSPDSNVGEDVPALVSDVHEATDLLDAGWPLLDVVDDKSDVTVKSTLDGYAAGLLEQFAGAPRTSGYEVRVGSTGWSPNNLGDTVRLKLSDLWHQQTVDLEVRPVACKVTAASRDSAESVELIFGGDQ